jgi:hypothetical protein
VNLTVEERIAAQRRLEDDESRQEERQSSRRRRGSSSRGGNARDAERNDGLGMFSEAVFVRSVEHVNVGFRPTREQLQRDGGRHESRPRTRTRRHQK